ncbi:uncharacterized protein [Periplaneta americana]|uniref:uncharacterized protein isoform X2 n=1 Tax=Periplaneta americana TaxID=6978 RepID=UPI0037E88FFD
MGSTSVAEGCAIPSWMNYDLLSEILSKEQKTGIFIRNFDAKLAVPKGDNYLSTLYRVIVEFSDSEDDSCIKNHNIIIKSLPAGEVLQQFLADLKGFEKEQQIYGVTFPAMYRIMKEKFPKEKFRLLSAKCLPCNLPNTLVLEDLQKLGYKMANRHKGLDVDHCRIAVRSLARLHAASVALYKKNPNSMDVFSETMIVDSGSKSEQMSTYFKMNLETLASKVGTWPGYEHYADRIRALIPNMFDQMVEITKPKKNSFNVLNHGDCWVNNMMFKYCSNTGKVQDIRFVDFQIARFASPALDLQHFLCTSCNNSVRFQQRDHLLEEYHAELSDSLSCLDLDPEMFTLQQLKDEFEDKENFGLMTICNELCFVLAQKDEVPDLNDLTDESVKSGEQNPIESVFSGQLFREVFQTFLIHYDNKGLL